MPLYGFKSEWDDDNKIEATIESANMDGALKKFVKYAGIPEGWVCGIFTWEVENEETKIEEGMLDGRINRILHYGETI